MHGKDGNHGRDGKDGRDGAHGKTHITESVANLLKMYVCCKQKWMVKTPQPVTTIYFSISALTFLLWMLLQVLSVPLVQRLCGKALQP
jgi:hypothetical protein